MPLGVRSEVSRSQTSPTGSLSFLAALDLDVEL